MKNIFHYVFLCLFFVAPIICMADDWDTSTRIFSPDFRSLKVECEDDFMSVPTISLDGDRKIIISFDELTSERSYLSYSLYHCNSDWKPSQLLEMEYLPGFNKADIEDFGFSRTTYTQYVNYRIEIPNEDMTPLVSGNYLLTVYPEDEPEEILLQARFCVSENSVPITANASVHTDRGTNVGLQQLAVELNTESLQGIDPFSEILLVVEQNGVPQYRRVIQQPFRVESGRVIYNHNADLLFPSGNEWRRFETVRVDYPGLHTDSTRFVNGNYQAYLTMDEGRADQPYFYDRTQFGRFKIREYNSSDSNLGADYPDTHFTLDFPQLMNADIYLDGEFTNHLLLPEYKLNYNTDDHLYRAVVPLKQGSYNYRYVAVEKDADGNPKGLPTATLVEGDKNETINEYHIQVFLRQHGARADRLLGDTLIYTTL